MRVDITLGVPRPPDDGDDPLDGIIAGSTLGAMLARMAFDYPDQMLARIKTDHGDGTYTCDRPGTNILMKMVPSNSPEFAEQLAVGMTVVIKFYNRDRRKPFIWRIAGGFEEAAMLWPRVTGNVRNSFSADANYDFDASMSEVEILSSDHEGDDYGAGSVILGYTIAGVEYMAVLTRASDGKVIVVGFDLADPTTPAFFSDPGDGTTGLTGTTFSHQMNPLAFHFCEDTSQLVVIGFSSPGRVILLDAVTGEIDLDNSATPITGNLTGAGSGVVESMLVNFSLFFSYDAAYTRTSLEELGTIRAYDLTADLAELWTSAVMLELFPSSVTYPIVLSHLRLTGGRAYAFGPGGAPAYAETEEAIMLAVAGVDGMPLCTPAGTYPAAYNVANTIPENYSRYVFYDNFVGPRNGATNNVASDSYTLRAWLRALSAATGAYQASYDFPALAAADHYMVDTASFTFSVGASSEAILAVLYSYFGTFSQSVRGIPSHLEFDLSAGSYAASGDPSWETPNDLRPVIGSLSAAYNTRTWAKHSVADIPRAATVGGQQYLYPHYEFFSSPAGYHFDPCPYLERTSTSPLSYTAPPAIWLDADDNLYLSWVQPKQIISARHSSSGDILAAHQITAAAMAATPHPAQGSMTVEWFGTPRIFCMYRSFLASFTPQLGMRWSVETTKYVTDTEDASGLSLPYGSFVFRMLATSAGLYVLRTQRCDDFSSLPIAYNTARLANPGTFTRDYMNAQYTGHHNATAGDHEPLLWAKLILELRNLDTGAVIWTQTLHDPTGTGTPTCIPAADMFANGSGVQGRFDTADATWGGGGIGMNYGNYSLGTATGTMFSATAAGAVSTRAATTEDPQASGTNKAPDLKTRVNTAHAMLGGKLYYNGWSAADSKWVISRLVAE